MNFEIQQPATPTRSEVRQEIAVLLKVELDRVWIRKMETKTGTNITLGLAHVYDNPVKALQVEPEHIIKRNQISERPVEEE